jgi:hypothetical protein
MSSWQTGLLRACAKLSVKLVHSTSGRPEGRGKNERFFPTVKGVLTVETASDKGEVGREIKDLGERTSSSTPPARAAVSEVAATEKPHLIPRSRRPSRVARWGLSCGNDGADNRCGRDGFSRPT